MKINHITIDKKNRVPIYIFGAKPKILLMAGMHGDEKTGVAILKKITKQLRGGHASYPVVIIPCVNLLAYQDNSRVNPKDRVDLNRIFPVTKIKSQSYQIARAIQHFAQKFTMVIDIHAFVGQHTMMCGVDLNITKGKINRKIKKVMSQIGLEAICRIDATSEPKKDGSLCAYLQHKKILAFGIELPPLEVLTNKDRSHITKNLMLFIEGSHKSAPSETLESYTRQQYLSKHTGMFSPKKFPGHEIVKNDEVGTLTKENKRVLIIRSPFDGKLISISYKKFVKRGNKIFVVGEKVIH